MAFTLIGRIFACYVRSAIKRGRNAWGPVGAPYAGAPHCHYAHPLVIALASLFFISRIYGVRLNFIYRPSEAKLWRTTCCVAAAASAAAIDCEPGRTNTRNSSSDSQIINWYSASLHWGGSREPPSACAPVGVDACCAEDSNNTQKGPPAAATSAAVASTDCSRFCNGVPTGCLGRCGNQSNSNSSRPLCGLIIESLLAHRKARAQVENIQVYSIRNGSKTSSLQDSCRTGGRSGQTMPVLLLLPLAWALSSGSTVSAERAVCLRRLTFDGQPPQDQRAYAFQACKNHAANTCCYPQHTELIKRRLGSLEDRGNCQKVSEEVLCVMCEPRFGTGELESKGKPILCPQLCEKWFNACKEEFVSASPSGSGSALTFCEESSLICSRLSATLEDSLSFCRQMGFHVPEDDDEGLPEGAVQGRRSCFNGIPTASFGSAPKRSDSDQRYRRSRDTQDDWEGWLRGIGFAVYEVLSRPEVWLLLLVLGFLLNQLVQQARDIMQTHMQEEKLRRRQQILQRYGVEEEEEEVESVADADEKDSAALSGEAEGEKGRAEPLRSSSQHSRPARERS